MRPMPRATLAGAPVRVALAHLLAGVALVAGCGREASETSAVLSSAKDGTCVRCHAGITVIHDRFALGCADCHGGDASVAVPEGIDLSPASRTSTAFQALLRAAHVLPRDPSLFYANGMDDDGDGLVDEAGEFAVGGGRDGPIGEFVDSELNEDLDYVRFLNPGDLRAARASCGSASPASRFTGQCHDMEVDAVRRSIMTMNSGVLDGAYYGNRALEGDPAPPPASNGDPRGGRFGFVLDWAAIDAGFETALNRFRPDASSATAGAGVTVLDLDSTTRTSRPGEDLPPGAPNHRRYQGFGGKPLAFPGRALPELRNMPDRPLIPASSSGLTLEETARRIVGDAIVPAGTTFGSEPVDSVVQGFRAYNTHLAPGMHRNFGGVDPSGPVIGQNNPFGRGRASGCTGCHVLYRRDGRNEEPLDRTVRENGRQPGTALPGGMDEAAGERFYPARHKLTTRIPTEQCSLCHGFVTRIDQSFSGSYELAGGLEKDTSVLPLEFTTPGGTSVRVFSNLARANDGAPGIQNDGEGASEDRDGDGELDPGEDANGNGKLDIPDRRKRSESFDGRQLRFVYGGASGAVLLRDIHLEKGMACIDCHFLQDAHGDGNIYARNWDAIEVECEDCHGTPGALGDLTTSGPNGGSDLRAARDEEGRPFFEIAADGSRIQRSRVTPGLSWRIPQVKEAVTPGHPRHNPRAERAMGAARRAGHPGGAGNAHISEIGSGGLECYSCHNAWQPNCLSCHYQQSYGAGLKEQRGIWTNGDLRNGFTDFALFSYTRSPFLLGTAGVTEGGKIATFRSTMEVHVSVAGPVAGLAGANHTIVDNAVFTVGAAGEITSGAAVNQHMPHTVRKLETRDCEMCHTLEDSEGRVLNNHILAGAVGQGTGRYQNLGDWLYVATGAGVSGVDFKKENAGTPRNAFPGFVLSDGKRFWDITGGDTPEPSPGAPRIFSVAAAGAEDVALIRNFTPPGGRPSGIDVAIAARGAAGVSFVDVTNRDLPPNRAPLAIPPLAAASLGAGASARGVDIQSPDLSDPLAVVAAGAAGLAVLDLSNLLSGGAAVSLTADDWRAPQGPAMDARDVALAGRFALVADASYGLVAVRVRGAASELGDALRATLGAAVTGSAHEVAVQGRFAWVAAGAGGLQVYDLDPLLGASPSAPVFVTAVASVDARGVALQGSRALVAGGAAGLVVVDVTRPEAPLVKETVGLTRAGDVEAPPFAAAVVAGTVPMRDFAVVSDSANGALKVVNTTDRFAVQERLVDRAALDPSYRFSLERRDPLTPRDPTNADKAASILVLPLGGATPAKIAKGAALDRIADEGARRLRESWHEGAGVVPESVVRRMRAVVVREQAGTADPDGNGLLELEEEP